MKYRTKILCLFCFNGTLKPYPGEEHLDISQVSLMCDNCDSYWDSVSDLVNLRHLRYEGSRQLDIDRNQEVSIDHFPLCSFTEMPIDQIHDAAFRGDTKLLKCLIGQDNSLVNSKDYLGHTPLYFAAGFHHFDSAKFLIRSGADINQSNFCGETPIFYTSEKIARLLLGHGARLDVVDAFNHLPIHSAAIQNYSRKVKLFLKNNSPIDVQDIYGCTPLHYAAFNSSREICEVLIKNGAYINIRNNINNTPLFDAMFGDKVADILINNGADCSVLNKDDDTPLHFAVRHHAVNAIALLLGKGVNVNQQNAFGETPLHLSITEWRIDIAQLLIKSCADITIVDAKGRSPLELAIEKKNYGIKQLLEGK